MSKTTSITDAAVAVVRSKVLNIINKAKLETWIFLGIFVVSLIVIFMNTFSNISILTKASDNENVDSGSTTTYLILNIFLLLIVIFFVGFYIYRLFNSRPIDSFLTKYFDLKGNKFGIPVYVGPATTFNDSIPSIGVDKFKGLDISNLRPNACKSKTECNTKLKDGRYIRDPRTNANGKCKDTYGSRNLNKFD
jgi:hypothetical protein